MICPFVKLKSDVVYEFCFFFFFNFIDRSEKDGGCVYVRLKISCEATRLRDISIAAVEHTNVFSRDAPFHWS